MARPCGFSPHAAGKTVEPIHRRTWLRCWNSAHKNSVYQAEDPIRAEQPEKVLNRRLL
jgi:hypothetical protein